MSELCEYSSIQPIKVRHGSGRGSIYRYQTLNGRNIEIMKRHFAIIFPGNLRISR